MSKKDEQNFLAACFYEAQEIDRGISDGISEQHFTEPRYRHTWNFLVKLRGEGHATDAASVYAAASNAGVLPALGGTDGIVDASTFDNGITPASLAPLRELLIVKHGKREAYKLLLRSADDLKSGVASLDDVRAAGERLVEIAVGRAADHIPVSAIATEAIAEAEAIIAGQADVEPGLTTGLPTFDRYCTPIRRHEIVVIAGRSSHGKSSLMMQIAMHNLKKGERVAIFTIETSAKSVLKQLAGQQASMNLRDIGRATSDQQREYLKWLRWLQENRNLMVFDRDLTMDAIESRARLIAQSFRPGLTVIDQLNNIAGGQGAKIYEKLSGHSKRLIPLVKALGSTLMVACQLGQELERDERPPTRTDVRDSSQVLEDCHRLITTWRKPNQPLDSMWFEQTISQLKNRDGPLCQTDVRFHAMTTRFLEASINDLN